MCFFYFLQFRDEVNSFAFIGIYNLGIYLSGADICMAEEFGDGVEVGSVGKGEGCEGVAADMEGYGLVDACVPDEGVETGR